ncbi:MAG: thioesterase superfamily protein [Candidatus Desulfovibrio kirbyi]|jgi:acyl-CoA thioesterase|uniref:Thioesterase superfamily protein n=1 Tax=Candidatus Desulfovibrio kirbyi TaxID=2696086 RepID=A0A6L2R6K6_9BACT|nr:PaaI family thioesterase [Desulfovibrio sp.]GFH63082.1 MAG: thioesterase superfamily protein [Candidatus Desulfovibrio kirbyi]
MENYVAKHDKLVRHLGMSVDTVRQGYAKVSMPLSDNVKNGMGLAHGGAIFSLADVAFGAAANADTETAVVSLSTSIEFLRPGKTGPLIAEATVTRSGKHIQSYDVKIFDGSGALIAKCMASGYQTDVPLPD